MERLWLILLCAALPLRGAEPPAEPGPVITPGEGDAAWRALFVALAAKGAVVSAYTERRWFAFRHAPVVLKGEMRFLPARGLSLDYQEPEARMVIVDEKGLLLRDARGHTRGIAAGDPRAMASLAALLPVMRFDFATLERTFEVHAARTGAAWRLDFVPRAPEEQRTLGRLVVEGEEEAVRRLEFRRSARQYVEILLSETRTGVVFTSEEEKRYFR